MGKNFVRYLLILVFTIPLFAKEPVTIGVVGDGDSAYYAKAVKLIKNEVAQLTKDEFNQLNLVRVFALDANSPCLFKKK